VPLRADRPAAVADFTALVLKPPDMPADRRERALAIEDARCEHEEARRTRTRPWIVRGW
jgi:hypothetical protein